MGFLSPLFLIGLLAAAVPIALHLFRQHAGPVVPFSAVRFVPRVPMHRTRRRQLQDVLLLALRVGALVLLAVSFARPYLSAVPPDRQTPLTVIAIDRSFSMSAPGQMERAHALAAEAVDELAGGELAAVVAFDERADVLQPPTTDRSEARRAVDSVSSSFGATRYDAVLATAAGLAAGRPARLIVVSDLQRNGWPDGAPAAAVPDSMAVETRIVGAPPDNLLVGAVRRTSTGVAAEIRSTGAIERTTRAWLSIDGETMAEQRIAVPAGGAAAVSFALPLPPRGAIAVGVEDETGYAADDIRYAVLDPAPSRRLLAIVNPDGQADALYLTKAVAAAEEGGALLVETLAADAIASRPDAFDGYEAVVVLGSRGFDARAGAALGAALDRGCGLLLVAGPGLDWPWLAGQLPANVRLKASGVETASTPLSLAPTDIRHPVFQPSSREGGWVGSATFRRILRLAPDADGRVLARFTNGAPALVEIGGGTGRTLVFASDLANQWNDFALQPGFVPFVHALVQHVAATRPPLRELLVGARPGERWAQPGVVPERPSETQSPRVAVNVDLREAAADPMTAEAFAGSVQRRASTGALPAREARAREAQQSWWWYGLLLMLVGLVVESAVGRARRAGAPA